MKRKTMQVFVAVTAVCAFMRLLLKLTKIDPVTGFYENAGLLSLALPGMMSAGAFAIFHTWIQEGRISPSHPYKGSIHLGLTAILLGLAVEFSSYEGTVDILQKIGGYNTRVTFQMLSVLLGCLTCLVLVMQGIVFIQKKGGLGVVPLSVPVLWMTAYLITHFAAYTALRSNSEQQLLVAFMLCALLFFMEHAGVMSGVRNNHMGRMVIFGYLASMFGLTLALPNLVGVTFGWLPFPQELGVADLVVVFFSSLYAFLCAAAANSYGEQIGWVPKIAGDSQKLPPPGDDG